MINSSAGRDVVGSVLSGGSFLVSRNLLDDYNIDYGTVSSASFSLFAYHGGVINSREDVPIVILASPEGDFSFVLSGLDFPAPDSFILEGKEVLQIRITSVQDGPVTVEGVFEEIILVQKSHAPIIPPN